MGIIVIDSCPVAVSVRVSCSLRVAAHVIVQPIIQRNTATGNSISLISRLRILVFHVSSFWVDGCVVFWWGYSLYEGMICIGDEFCVVLYILNGVLRVAWLLLMFAYVL